MRIFGARAEGGVVGLDGPRKRFAGLPEGFGALRRARPQVHRFRSSQEGSRDVAPSNDEGIPVLRSLPDANCPLACFAGIFRRLFAGLTAGMHQEISGHTDDQVPHFRRHAPGGENPACWQEFRTPTLRGQEKSVGSKTEGGLIGAGPLELHGEPQRVPGGDDPRLRKIEQDVAGIIWRSREGKSSFVPLGYGLGKVKATATGEAKLKGGKRLVAGVLELVDSFDANDWLRGRNKLYCDLLSDDRVPRAECRRATASNIGDARQ